MLLLWDVLAPTDASNFIKESMDCPALQSSLGEEDLIVQYFKDGYTYEDICKFLRLRHDILLTLDQLRNRLKQMGLRRRDKNAQTSFEEIQAAIRVSLQWL